MNYQKITDLSQLHFGFFSKLMSILYGFVLEVFLKKEINTLFLPKVINEYTLVKPLHNKRFPFQVGLYTSKKDEHIVIKVWHGKRRNIYYFNLAKEIITSEIFTRLQKKLKLDVFVPTFLGAYKNEDTLLHITKYISDNYSINKLSHEARVDAYLSVLTFFNSIYKLLDKKDSTLIGIKDRLLLGLQFPLLFTVAFLKHPTFIGKLFFGGIAFWLSLILSGKLKKSVVHGDLHAKNILVTDTGSLFVIDFEQTVITYRYTDLAATLSSLYNSQSFSSSVFNTLYKTFNEQEVFQFSLLTIFNSFYNLTSYKKNDEIRQYGIILNLGTRLAFEQLVVRIRKTLSQKIDWRIS